MFYFKLIASNLSKSYNYKESVFKNISLTIQPQDIIGITGPNGSGKSTLLKLLANIIQPTEGSISFEINGKLIEKNSLKDYIFLIAPYLSLYEEFTAVQFLKLTSKIAGKKIEKNEIEKLLIDFNLKYKENDEIRTYSSGMKQRLKFLIGFLFNYKILLFDEPFTNLDEQGITILKNYIQEFINNGNAVLIATNNKNELQLCKTELNLPNKIIIEKRTDLLESE